MGTSAIRDIVRSYSSPSIKAYAGIRFLILQAFLEEIDQYLPLTGRVLDLGCGFGLFSLYFARRQPNRQLVGVDMHRGRIDQARRSAGLLGLHNVEYRTGNVLTLKPEGMFDAIYMLDVLHHLPAASVPRLLAQLKDKLRPGGVLLLKEVADRPWPKMWFTLVLDRAMVGFSDPIKYWSPGELSSLVGSLGFDVKHHRMRDVLPYPHVLYVCRKDMDP